MPFLEELLRNESTLMEVQLGLMGSGRVGKNPGVGKSLLGVQTKSVGSWDSNESFYPSHWELSNIAIFNERNFLIIFEPKLLPGWGFLSLDYHHNKHLFPRNPQQD